MKLLARAAVFATAFSVFAGPAVGAAAAPLTSHIYLPETGAINDAADLLTDDEEATLLTVMADAYAASRVNVGFESISSLDGVDPAARFDGWSEANSVGQSAVFILAARDGTASVQLGSVYRTLLGEQRVQTIAETTSGLLSSGQTAEAVEYATTQVSSLLPPQPPLGENPPTAAPQPTDSAEPAETLPAPARLVEAATVFDEQNLLPAGDREQIQEILQDTAAGNLYIGVGVVDAGVSESAPQRLATWTEEYGMGGAAAAYILYQAGSRTVDLATSSTLNVLVDEEQRSYLIEEINADLATGMPLATSLGSAIPLLQSAMNGTGIVPPPTSSGSGDSGSGVIWMFVVIGAGIALITAVGGILFPKFTKTKISKTLETTQAAAREKKNEMVAQLSASDEVQAARASVDPLRQSLVDAIEQTALRPEDEGSPDDNLAEVPHLELDTGNSNWLDQYKYEGVAVEPIKVEPFNFSSPFGESKSFFNTDEPAGKES